MPNRPKFLSTVIGSSRKLDSVDLNEIRVEIEIDETSGGDKEKKEQNGPNDKSQLDDKPEQIWRERERDMSSGGGEEEKKEKEDKLAWSFRFSQCDQFFVQMPNPRFYVYCHKQAPQNLKKRNFFKKTLR